MEKIVILGSTGSIGRQSLDIIKEKGGFEILALACRKPKEVLKNQISFFKPSYVSLEEKSEELEKLFPEVCFFYGEEGIKTLSSLKEADTVLNALVGSSGLVPTLNAIKNHKKVLLANKETLVIGGEIVKEYLKEYNGTLYPIDSEHSALWEMIDEYGKENIEKMTITASGGALRDYEKKNLENVKVKEVLSHPNWSMGEKITVDSATMVNKGFEIIEAHYLFDMSYTKLSAVIQRDSLCHAFVTLKDKSVKYNISSPSMKGPITRALYYPKIQYEKEKMDKKDLVFEEIEEEKYPSFNFIIETAKKNPLLLTVLNAANEMAVSLFLDEKIKYTDIFKINYEMVMRFSSPDVISLENIIKYDKIVKDYVKKYYS
ncbi:MAG: 1-deoxy-D-xylulose-5-phosphate reductoisomerase [Bacillales bacterium]|nr:1-deoxy-D-xylulose-5-phosphate reductoisomerase [Bacillales bacterium]